MFQSCGCHVARFCSCSGLNGLVVAKWKPMAAVITSSAGSQVSSVSPRRAKASRNSARTTPLSAKPAITMEITQ
jgi:hypothetical protein